MIIMCFLCGNLFGWLCTSSWSRVETLKSSWRSQLYRIKNSSLQKGKKVPHCQSLEITWHFGSSSCKIFSFLSSFVVRISPDESLNNVSWSDWQRGFFHFSKWSQEAKAAQILHIQQVHTQPHSFSQPHVCVWSVKLGPTFSGSTEFF